MSAAERLDPDAPPVDPNVGRRMEMEEFLDLCETTGRRYERHRGVVVAPPEGMSGARVGHNKVADDIQGELRDAFKIRGDDCTAYRADQCVRSEEFDKDCYPDVVAHCGPGTFIDRTEDRVLVDPCLAVEVLSESTGRYDHDGKFGIYQSIPSLTEYLVVDPHGVSVKLFRRLPTGWFLQQFTELDAAVELESVRVSLPMAEIYRRVLLIENPTAGGEPAG